MTHSISIVAKDEKEWRDLLLHLDEIRRILNFGTIQEAMKFAIENQYVECATTETILKGKAKN